MWRWYGIRSDCTGTVSRVRGLGNRRGYLTGLVAKVQRERERTIWLAIVVGLREYFEYNGVVRYTIKIWRSFAAKANTPQTCSCLPGP
jgi:hypothetical protein